MSKSDNSRLNWFVAAALVLAVAGGVLFFVLKARVEAAERRALLDQHKELSHELNQLEVEVVTIHQMRHSRFKMTEEEYAEAKAEDRLSASPATGGHPQNSRGHEAHIRKQITEVEERMRTIKEVYEARFGSWPE